MDPVHAAVAEALRGWGVGRARRILVAVSGGADSVALLHVLAGLGQRLAVGHVHHGLRDDADLDQAFVAELAQHLGVPCGARRVDARAADGRSPEARARVHRYAALEELRRERGASFVATAHTRDDQAETLLLRAVRGTGVAGLAGIEPRADRGRLLRPVLRLGRADLRHYLGARGLRWREDPSNADLSVPRNRLRAEVLPVLERIHPRATERLAALAELAREARDDEGTRIEAALAEAVQPAESAQTAQAAESGCWLTPQALAALSSAERQRALALCLARAGLGDRVTRAHLRRMARFLDEAPRGAALSLPGDFALVRRAERFWLGPAQAAPGAEPRKSRRGAGFRILLPRADVSGRRVRRPGER